MKDDYWDQSLQPLNCLTFVAPLLALYEIGAISLGSTAMRNGADVWLRGLLGRLGLGEFFFLPLLTCGLLLGWHHLTRDRWRVRTEVLSGMVCESFALGVLLVVIAKLCGNLLYCPPTLQAAIQADVGEASRVPLLLSYLGAGIYEELLFRLLLLSGTIALCRKMGADATSAISFAVIAISLFFAAAHYALFFQVGLAFTWYSFVFRIFAGVLFSILFLTRGFGVTVGTHCVYDILVATLH